MQKIHEPVSCGCSSEFHESVVVDLVIPNKNASQVFDALQSKRVLEHVQQAKQSRNLNISEWKQRPDGILERQVEYTMPIKMPIAPAHEAQVIDVEMILSRGPQSFVLEKHSVAPKMPYSDDFVPMIRFCTYDVQGGAKFIASVWIRWLYKPMLVKKKIDQATMDGLQGTAREYSAALQQILTREE